MEEGILKTLAYFDLFEYPLTTIEVWKYAQTPSPCELGVICSSLTQLLEDGRVEHERGFWFLSGRSAVVRMRLERYPIAERKYRKAHRAVEYLRRIPTIRMIAVANTLAWGHARDGSDIDLFIVTRPGAIWRTRLLGVTPFALLGLRPRPDTERDTFCFSFFATEAALDLAPLAIMPEDPYLLYWVATLVPLYDPDGLVEGLYEANPWVRERLPNVRAPRPVHRRRTEGWAAGYAPELSASRGFTEHAARAIQLARLPVALRTMMNVDHRVVVTDDILKFHVNDRREEIAARYWARCREVCGI